LVSALSGRKIRRDVAMTGELTLTGRVLPIGGIKEKLLGAVRAGIDEIILPRDNEADLDDLREDVRNSLTVHLVEDLDQVIKIALKSDVAKKAKKKAVKSKPGAKASPSQSPASA
jgi:ATP-dependent Lon protease